MHPENLSIISLLVSNFQIKYLNLTKYVFLHLTLNEGRELLGGIVRIRNNTDESMDPYDMIVTHPIALDQVEDAILKMRDGTETVIKA